MSKIWQVVCVSVVSLVLGLAMAGCDSSSKDKMKGDKMDKMTGDKMTTDKMNKMTGDKMDKMTADKMAK